VIKYSCARFWSVKTEGRTFLHESDADKTDEEIVVCLMEITALSLADLLADEP
jgi:hypothetical protein